MSVLTTDKGSSVGSCFLMSTLLIDSLTLILLREISALIMKEVFALPITVNRLETRLEKSWKLMGFRMLAGLSRI